MLAKRARLVLYGVVCVVYFYGLGAAPFVGPDEPRYAEVAREMFARGDWVTPTLAGHTWFEKPALLYWLMMSAYGALGVTELAARLGAALSGVLTVLTVGWLALRTEREAGPERRGFALLCAAVTASSAGLLVFARAASFDVLLTATVTLALACFFVAETEERASKRNLLLAGCDACVGLSLLAKGLVGLVLPAGIVGLYYLLRRRRPRPARLGWWWGPLVSLACAAVWYAPVIARHGWQFIDEFFVQHHFARYLSNKYNHPQPFYFYVPIVALLALPWTVFLVGALWGARRWRWRADAEATDEERAVGRLRVFALAWLAVPVVFFSASGSKLPGYVLPALPGAALLASEQLWRYARRGEGRRLMRATGVMLLLLSLGGGVYAWRSLLRAGAPAHDAGISVACLASVLLLVCASGVAALCVRERRALVLGLLVGATLLTVVLGVGGVLGGVAEGYSVAGLMRRAEAEGAGQLPVMQLHTVERTAEFYAAGRLLYDERGEPLKFEGTGQVVEATRRGGGRALVIVPRRYVNQLTDDPRLVARPLGDNGRVALVLVMVTEP